MKFQERCGMQKLLASKGTTFIFMVFSWFNWNKLAMETHAGQKPIFLNSNLIWNQWMKSHSMDMLLQIPIYLFVYLFFSFQMQLP